MFEKTKRVVLGWRVWAMDEGEPFDSDQIHKTREGAVQEAKVWRARCLTHVGIELLCEEVSCLRK